MKLFRIMRVSIEKFLRRNREKFTNIKEIGHSGKGFSIFNGVDISGVLTDGETHVSCGNAFVYAELGKTLGKVFLVHSMYHRPLSYCIE